MVYIKKTRLTIILYSLTQKRQFFIAPRGWRICLQFFEVGQGVSLAALTTGKPANR